MGLKPRGARGSLLLILGLIFLPGPAAWAKPVSADLVQKVGQTKVGFEEKKLERDYASGRMKRSPAGYSKRSVKQTREITDKATNKVLAYVLDLSPKGYIVVSPDTDITPVIAYSFESDFIIEEAADNVLLHLVSWDMDNRLKAIPVTPLEVKDANSGLWGQYLDGELAAGMDLATYGPILSAATWNQGTPYNNYCPADPETYSASVTGCVATAMAQIVNYFAYPGAVTFNYSDNYTSSIDPGDGWGTRTISISATTANFSGMSYPVSTNANKAALSYACGVATRMNYSSYASGTSTSYVATALKNKFGYASADYKESGDADFYPTLQSNMQNNRPAQVSIRNSSGAGGHSIVCDGYNTSTLLYHLNLGWGGTADAWYSLPNIGTLGGVNYNTVTGAVVNIATSLPAPSVTGLNPATGSAGGLVIITGANFGSTTGTVKFYNNQPATVVSWSSTQIKCLVPSGAATGSVTVTTGGGTSGGVTFTVGKPQSPHDYPADADFTATYTLAGSPGAIDVAFDAQTSVEQGYDYIYVMDGNGTGISGSPFTGTELAGQTKRITGATVKIRLTSDPYFEEWGYGVTAVTAVDITPPSTIASVYDGTGADIIYSTWPSQLSANWTASADAQSGVARYWYAIGTSPGAVNILTWTDNNTNTSVTKTGLSLANGQTYHFSVKAENGAGLQSIAANSNGQSVDTTAPSDISAVYDGTGADITYAGSASQLSANWAASADTQSGVAKYWYAIGTTPGGADVAAWTNNNASLSVTRTGLSLAGGQTYYVAVKAENGAGLFSGTASSNGQTLDATAPASTVTALGLYTNSRSFAVQWSGSDTGGSTLAAAPYEVQYKVGAGAWADWPGYTQTSAVSGTFGPASPVVVEDGQLYYFRCRARDNAGNVEAYPGTQDAFTRVDVSSPPAPAVDSATHAEDVYSITDNDPVFEWTPPSDVSGIAGYSLSLDHAQDSVPALVLNFAGSTTQYMNIGDGFWYFHVRAKDNAGNWGPADTYGPVKIDTIAPIFTSILSSSGPAKAGNVTVSVTASEQMGQVSVSVTQNGNSPVPVLMTSQDTIGWTGVYAVASGFDGSAAIAVTGTDLAGKAGSGSGSFVVDTVAPADPGVSSPTHPENTPTSKSVAGFAWSASGDGGGSGLAGYSYALNQAESFSLDAATETVSTAYTSPPLGDGTYWFHLAAVDNAGNLSAADIYKFVVDTASPTFTAAAEHDPARAGNVAITVNSDESLSGAPTVTVRQNGQGGATAVALSAAGANAWQGVYTVVGGFDGTAVITVSGGDLAANTTAQTRTFQVDTAGPSADIAFSPAAPLKSGAFGVTVTLQDASFVPQAPLLSFTLSDGTTMPVTLTGSDKNWQGSGFIYSSISTGTAAANFSAADAAGNTGTAITSGGTVTIDISVNGVSGGSVTENDGTAVVLPPNAYAGSLNVVMVAPDQQLTKITYANNNTHEIVPVTAVNLNREFSASDSNTGAPVSAFDAPLTITIPYPDADNDGVVDGTNIREDKLSLFWLNEALSKWEKVLQTTPDAAQNTLSAYVVHFSIYALLSTTASNFDTVRVYPVPWTPGSGDKYDSPPLNCGPGIQIDNLTSEAKISIFDLQGERVRKLSVASGDGGCKAWDGRNEAGRNAASGVYLAVIEGSFDKKVIKKLVIER